MWKWAPSHTQVEMTLCSRKRPKVSSIFALSRRRYLFAQLGQTYWLRHNGFLIPLRGGQGRSRSVLPENKVDFNLMVFVVHVFVWYKSMVLCSVTESGKKGEKGKKQLANFSLCVMLPAETKTWGKKRVKRKKNKSSISITVSVSCRLFAFRDWESAHMLSLYWVSICKLLSLSSLRCLFFKFVFLFCLPFLWPLFPF